MITQPAYQNLDSNHVKNLNSQIETAVRKELSPFINDSKLNVTLEKSQGAWAAHVAIDSHRGIVATRQTATLLPYLTQKIILDLKSQLKKSQTPHQHEIFMFDLQQEYDYYTEVVTLGQEASIGKLKVLVIEDDATASLILQKSLESKNCLVKLMSDPEQALNFVAREKFDLIILDWCLPYMDGHEFLVRANSILTHLNQGQRRAQTVPLVVCSSKAESEINLPLVPNFLFCQYWNKQLPFSTVISSIESALLRARSYKNEKYETI